MYEHQNYHWCHLPPHTVCEWPGTSARPAQTFLQPVSTDYSEWLANQWWLLFFPRQNYLIVCWSKSNVNVLLRVNCKLSGLGAYWQLMLRHTHATCWPKHLVELFLHSSACNALKCVTFSLLSDGLFPTLVQAKHSCWLLYHGCLEVKLSVAEGTIQNAVWAHRWFSHAALYAGFGFLHKGLTQTCRTRGTS